MSDTMFPGLYRGIVEDVNDPDQRKRYRVRVLALHPEEVPTSSLPWAETSMFAGKMFGDLIAYEPGDRVFIMFEGANRRFPVIVGGFMSQFGGVPDAPSEVRADYAETQSRWIRVDRVGNKIEMSPLPGERWIKLQSGEAEILLSMNDGSVSVVSNSQVNVTAPQVSVDASEQVTVKTKILMAQVDETATVRAGDVVNVHAGSKINIGRYEDEITGALNPQTCDEVDIRANDNVKIESTSGTLDVDADQDITVNTQSSATQRAETEMVIDSGSKTTIKSDADVLIQANGGKVEVEATDDVTVSSDAKVTVTAATQIEVTAQNGITIKASASNISIDAEAGNLDLHALGAVNVTSDGSGKFETTGPLTLKSSSQVSIQAPVVDVTADATGTFDGGASCSIKGGIINIG